MAKRKSTARLRFYRALNRRVIAPWLLPRFRPLPRWSTDFSFPSRASDIGGGRQPRVWFHGASAGEIECIAEILEQMAERWIGVEIILTVFSKSGVSQTKTLGSSLETSGAVLLYEGYCPWEGQWFGALDWLRPDVFVTAKYEAWPDLWSSLAALDIPLTVVSARARNSLAIVRRFAKLVGVGLPDLTFTVTEDSQSEALRSLFPEARIEVTGDPRWDRAIQRSKGAVRSTDHLTARFSSLKC